MKKNYLLGVALIASLSFNSCTKEIVYVQDGTESIAEDVQQITLQVENGGDSQKSRAGRPMYGAEAKQDIQTVKLWICSSDKKVVYVKDISNWNTEGSTAYTTGGHGRQTTIKLEGEDKLGPGAYTVYAVGYSTTSDYTLDAVTGVAKGNTFSENMVLPIKAEAENKIGEEIFAGAVSLTISEKGAGSATTVLNRQVAGTFAYVKDIPYFQNAKYLKLVASAQNQDLVLGNFNSFNLTGNGTGNEANVKYVVNGTNGKSGSETYVISEIDLTKWFTTIKDSNGDGLIDLFTGDTEQEDTKYANWTNPYSADENHPTFQKGSVFGGEFVIPFAHVDSKNTLTLQLTNDGGTALSTWTVKLPTGDSQLSSQTITYWDSSTWATFNDDSQTAYSLVRNHLYGIGTRMNDQVDPENPDKDPDPTDPGTDPDKDKPESLLGSQELVLQVNDNWEVIHGMELE